MAVNGKKKALVLSGGGAKGAFQVGALEVLLDHPHYRHFDVICGISVGALNGTMLAMGKFDALMSVWEQVKDHPEKVYGGKVGKHGEIKALSAVWQAILRFKQKSILDLEPLRRLMDSLIQLDEDGKVPIEDEVELQIGAVSLLTGLLEAFNPRTTDGQSFKQAVLASATMPIIWPPVQIIAQGPDAVWIDGGVRDTSPIRFALGEGVDEIVVVNCTPEDKPLPPREAGQIKHILDVFKRSLVDIAMNEVFLCDLSTFREINELIDLLNQQHPGTRIMRKDGRPYRKIDSLIIEPDHHLPDVLDFTGEAIGGSWAHGRDRARAALGLAG